MASKQVKPILDDNCKAVLSWSLYDWANSAFATTVMAGFFPIFFKDFWSLGVDAPESTMRLLVAKIAAGIILALLAPILGAVADQGSSRKKFLIFFTYMGVVMAIALSCITRGNWTWAAGVYVLAWLGYAGGNIFYDSLLTNVAAEKTLDFVSALGYGMGYLGGAILFSLNVWMTLAPDTFGFADSTSAVRFSFVTVGVWWAVFSIPIFLFVKEPINPARQTGLKMVSAGLGQLRDTFRQIRHAKVIFLFLLAYWLYIDAVDTIIHMAVDYGKSLNFDNGVLIKALLLTNFVGFPAAVIFGWLGGKIGAKRGIFIALGVYLFITIWGAVMRCEREFYIIALLIGLVQGGIQSLSRSFYARLIPSDKTAEFFGFFNMIGKFAALFGLALMYGMIFIARCLGYAPLIQTRLSITSISLLFLAGGVILYFVSEDKGRQQLEYLS